MKNLALILVLLPILTFGGGKETSKQCTKATDKATAIHMKYAMGKVSHKVTLKATKKMDKVCKG